MNLEQVRKPCRRDIDNRKKRFALREERIIRGQKVTGDASEVPVPVVFVHYDNNFTGLAADIREQRLVRTLAGNCHDSNYEYSQKGLP